MSRDPVVDALRAVAIGGVVLGHWLVTALVVGQDGTLATASPLATMPALAPASWVLQTLGLFFFAAGYASTRSSDRHGTARRLGRLLRPTLALLGVGATLLLSAIVLGVPDATLSVALTLAVSPLWFLLPLLAFSVSAGPLRSAVRRWGPLRCAGTAAAVVAALDLAGGALPGRLPAAVLAAWSVPWLLGVAHADGRLTGRRAGAALAVTGAVGIAAAIAAGYPVSAVGVPGAATSNLHPPSLFAVALAVAQVGFAVLLRPALAGLLSRPAVAGAVTAVNRRAVRIYLWHQPVLVGVTALLAHLALLPGLHTAPTGPGWLFARLCWLPVLAAVLALVTGARTAPDGPPGRAARALPVYADRCLRADVRPRSGPRRPQEVIAVRDSDPPSRGRAHRQPR
ncbi:acyltransferase family protein [Micromonospora humi]|uniref:Acyltransferase family protein n=1 Tax=Micromonospora humi TaxID=745366 RepID=A0A1C5JF13_9ACTN|nr:acyltransferase [Micromonospora humi]SCG69142.1 Acyltransferase family protein [Micromonospora humi]